MKVKSTIQKAKLLSFTFWFLLFTFFFLLFNISCAQKEGVNRGDKVPDFTLKDLSGTDVKLSEVIKNNKATLLVFWATWCPYCVNEIPQLKMLHANYKDKGLKILAIDVGESVKKLESFVEEEGMDYTILLDSDNAVANQYGISGIPANILVDNDGVIKHKGVHPPPENLLP